MPIFLSEQRQKIFLDRYALKDDKGNTIETTVEQMWERVSSALVKPEDHYAFAESVSIAEVYADKFYSLLDNFKFVPGGRILSGAGTGQGVSFYNCFVIPSPEDSREGILDNLKLMIEVMARGGGVGINISSLRPRGTHVKGVNGTASGPVNWGELYSVATADVVQQGGTRRGALMLMLDVDHPDIMEFITYKKLHPGKLEGANLSVAISDDFMLAVKEDLVWNLVWGENSKIYKTVRARDIWHAICESAWAYGDPGMVFLERYQKQSNTWYTEEIIAVNPCGEQGLPAYGVCNLGSINLSEYIYTGNTNPELMIGELEKDVKLAVRFLDNAIDTTPYFIPENEKAQKTFRRIGLGTMGLADMLIKLKIRYGSQQSLSIMQTVYSTIRNAAYRASIDLAREKGSFPGFKPAEYLEGIFIQSLPEDIQKGIDTYGIRNSHILTQAPTGTTSLLAGVSSGIEPVYDFVMKRSDRTGVHVMVHPLYQEWENQCHPPHPKAPDYFVTANQLTPEEHIVVQATIQNYVDTSISKTVNAPNSQTVEDVERLYMMAYDLGCKGITYFRDGSRNGVLEHIEEPKETPIHTSPKPKAIQEAQVYRLKYPHDNESATIYVTIAGNGHAEQVFLNGKGDSEILSAIGWLVSKLLQHGMNSEELVEDLWEFKGKGGIFNPGHKRPLTSLPNVVAQALQLYNDRESIQDAPIVEIQIPPNTRTCPKCEAFVSYKEGCISCDVCGWSKCG